MTIRFLIFNPVVHERTQLLTYQNMVEKGGFGGTEVAFLEIGRYLCKTAGYTVHLVGFSNKTYFDESSGMQFFSLADFPLESVNTYHWYSPLFHISDPYHYDILRHIKDKRSTKVLFWFQCFVDNEIVLAHKAQGFDVYGIGVSEWCTNHYAHPVLFDSDHLWTVRNAVSPSFHRGRVIDQASKQKGMWSFHATYLRGCPVAMRVFEKVRRVMPQAATSFQMMSYWTPDTSTEVPEYVVKHGSLSKLEVAHILAKTEYFVYALSTPNLEVYHDTFACVIMEALSLGVIVITWNVACIPSMYSDYVVGLEPPSWYRSSDRYGYDPYFASDDAVQRLTDAVIQLEANPGRKENIRQRGIEWSRQQTWDKSSKIMAERLKTLARKT